MHKYRSLINSYIHCNVYGGLIFGDVPIIKAQMIDTEKVSLISCVNTKYSDLLNSYKGVHFFVDDQRFKATFENPEKYVDKYKQYAFVLSPDFSLYADMSPQEQFDNLLKNRTVGAFWQAKGLTVIPTISWSTPFSYAFCFQGVEIGAIVAISTVGCKRRNKSRFLNGYEAMLSKLRPQKILCFGNPFSEMRGPLIVVDYKNSWEVYRGR